MDDRTLALLRELHASQAVRFGTTAPFDLRELQFKRIGFADIPVVEVVVYTADVRALIPIVRQYVLHELALHGLPPEAVAFTPSVGGSGRKRRFTDRNESSPTLGKNKMGRECEIHFEIQATFLHRFRREAGHSLLTILPEVRDGETQSPT